MIPDWKLPPGVDRGLWEYVSSETLARQYDERLAGTPLLRDDLAFVARHFTTPGRLIDLGCGTGRLMFPYARKGYDCWGVDLSDSMLAVVAEKAAREGLPIRTLKANLVELDEVESASFDHAACLFSTLGMIRGVDNRRKFLGHVRRILKPGGVFVLHGHNRWFRFGLGLGARGSERGDRTMPQTAGGPPLTLHHFSKRELLAALKEAGFEIYEVQPVSTSGILKHSWWLPMFRAYGYLLAAIRR